MNTIIINTLHMHLLLGSVLGYIDGGTGSIILQALVAAVVGIGIAFKLFWHRILKFLGIRKKNNRKDPENHYETKK